MNPQSPPPTPAKTVTRGEQMLALRKRRMAAAIPFLRGGFRPFFFGAATWGVVAIALWLCALAGDVAIPSGFAGVAWHRHEMIFGFVGAAVSGFLLTAIPNWTGRLPIAGKPLLALFGMWALARVAVFVSAIFSLWVAALFDVGLFVGLAGLAAREVIASKNRNMPVVALVLLFGLADAADYLGQAGVVDADLGWRTAVSLVVIMISVIGGRIIPSFTRNWMAKRGISRGLPRQPEGLDLLVIVSTAVALLFWIAFPDEELTGGILTAAAAAQLLRLARWSGYRTFPDALVLILHVGYLWIPAGLFLLGLAAAGFPVPSSAGVHSLTAGAMATMILAVMSRASLGHTGHALRASPVTVCGYACVTVGALVRVAASLGVGSYALMLDIAGGFWGAAMLLFLVAYAPILWRPRVGERR